MRATKRNAGRAPGVGVETVHQQSPNSSTAGAGAFVVWCKRHDGRLRRWKSYPTLAEAEQVARHLCKIGCPSIVRRDGEVQP